MPETSVALELLYLLRMMSTKSHNTKIFGRNVERMTFMFCQDFCLTNYGPVNKGSDKGKSEKKT